MANNKNFVFHIFDIKLAQEWWGTCNEYVGFLKSPFNPIPVKSLISFNQSDWAEAYKEWGILQFYVGVITAIVFGCVFASYHGGYGPGHGYGNGGTSGLAFQVLYRIVLAYLFAHYSWFAVTRRNGCCCFFIVICVECPLMLLLWGILCMVYGILGFIGAFSYVAHCGICILFAICQAVYSITLFYMGLCCFKIWMQRGSEIVPPAVEVVHP
jgi:hypothetical protein